MEGLYPKLENRFRAEGLCPICLTEMVSAPKYSCDSGHSICFRCKPYYNACPTCRLPFNDEEPVSQAGVYQPPPPTHFMPHPIPPQYFNKNPTAPPMEEFLENERHTWFPPYPPAPEDLRACSYSHLGCWVKLPPYLQELHESRCQFRPNLEEEHLPTDLIPNEDELVACRYQQVGCTVRTTPWRLTIHENCCAYKAKYDAMNNLSEGLTSVRIADSDSESGDPEELVECKYRKYGCMVNMPRRRKRLHQEKCNYRKDEEEEEEYTSTSSEDEGDPDEQVPCRWAEYGCRVRPKRSRQPVHEEKCNYRMEECTYGCGTLVLPSAKYAHERSCQFASYN